MKSIFSKFNILDTKIEKIKKIPWILGSYAFSIILMFILLDLMLGEFLFYKYIILVKKEEPVVIQGSIRFEDNAYLKVVEEWQKKEQKFEGTNVEEFLNPFITKSDKTEPKDSIDLKR